MRVHHVLDALLVPGGGVGMVWKHAVCDYQASHVPTILFGFGVAPAARGRLDRQETIRLGRDDTRDALLELCVQIIPHESCAEDQSGGPHGRLPTAAPGLAVRALLRA